MYVSHWNNYSKKAIAIRVKLCLNVETVTFWFSGASFRPDNMWSEKVYKDCKREHKFFRIGPNVLNLFQFTKCTLKQSILRRFKHPAVLFKD